MNAIIEKGKAVVKHPLVNWFKDLFVGFNRSHCALHAAGLTYFSMLAVVPILCILLLAAKTCLNSEGIQDRIREKTDAMIVEITSGATAEVDPSATPTEEEREKAEKKRIAAEEFREQAKTIRDGLLEQISKFSVKTLGFVGLLLLVWTIIGSIGKVETSFNEIWDVEKPRVIWKRAIVNLFIAFVLPVMAVLSMSMPIIKTVVRAIEALKINDDGAAATIANGAVDWINRIIDSQLVNNSVMFFFCSLAFATLFYVLPNCRVRFKYAFIGGMVTALFFGLWVKLCAVLQVGIAKSSALYGSFAFLPIVLAWMYTSWQIVLLGANVVRLTEKRAADKALEGDAK